MFYFYLSVALVFAISINCAICKKRKKELKELMFRLGTLEEIVNNVSNGLKNCDAFLTSVHNSVISSQTDIDNLRSAHDTLSNNFTEHLNSCCGVGTNTKKVGNNWTDAAKNECKAIIAKNKALMTYEQIMNEVYKVTGMDVPLSTLKRWGKEL